MKNLKRIIIAVLALSMLLSLFACKKNNGGEVVDSGPTVSPVSFLDYAVVRPYSVPNDLLDHVSNLAFRLMEVSGLDNSIQDDFLEKGQEPDPGAKEILIGHTNRPETAQVLSQLAGNEFAVAVVGNKLVITGIVESMTPYAVEYFMETYLGEGADGNVPGDLFYKGVKDVVVLVENGEPVYTIVRPEYSVATMMESCARIYDIIYEATGVSIPVNTDRLFKGETHDNEAFEILIGDVSYDMLDDIKTTIAPDEYRIDFVGNKVVIFSWSDEGVDLALEEFKEMLSYGSYTDSEGNTTVSIIKEAVSGKNTGLKFPTDIPMTAGGVRYSSVYNANDGAMMLYWKTATEDMLGSYVESLKADGYTHHQTLNNDSIHSTTYYKGERSVCAYYFKRVGELRVVAQDGVKILPVNPYEYEKVCDPLVMNIGAYEYYWYREGFDGYDGDMGFIIRLEDGTFVIIDGGYHAGGINTNEYAKDVYEKLLELRPEGVEDIVISAWFITHGHGDHHGLLRDMLMEYEDKIKVKMLIGNDPNDKIIEQTEDMDGRAFNYNSVNGKFGGCVNIKGHAGQQFFFPGATFTILHTHEDSYPTTFKLFNDYSTIFDTVIQGKRFLWFGDAMQSVSPLLIAKYQTDLKSDVCQLAHHGNKGTVTAEVYKLVLPTEAFWPLNSGAAAELRLQTSPATKWVVDYILSNSGWENIHLNGDGWYTIWFGEPEDGTPSDPPLEGEFGGDDATEGEYTKDYS